MRFAKRANRVTSLINSYLDSAPCVRSSGFLAYLREHDPFVLAHHDPCRQDFHDHVLCFRGFYICRGCAATATATAFGAVVGVGTAWPSKISTGHLGALFGFALMVAVIPIRGRRRTLRNDSQRLVLGMLLGSACAALFVPTTMQAKIAIICAYLGALALWTRALRPIITRS